MVSAAPEGLGFIFSFILADANGSPVRSSGTAIVALYEEFYVYNGPDMELRAQDTFFVTLNDYAPTTSGYLGCFLPRVDLSHVKLYQSTTGAFYRLYFVVDGDTILTKARTAWPI
jgi:hypothetical protein